MAKKKKKIEKKKNEVEVMKSKIKNEVRRAQSESGKGMLNIAFKKLEGLPVVGVFLNMLCEQEIALSEEQQAILESIWLKGMWGCPNNLNVKFALGIEFKKNKFVDIMSTAINDIKAI